MKATFLLLTYKTHIEKEGYRSWFRENVYDCKSTAIAHETGDVECPYEHTHMVIHLGKSYSISRKRVESGFDYEGIHPNVKILKGKKAYRDALVYISKEDKDIGVEIPKEWKAIIDTILKSDSVKDVLYLTNGPSEIMPYLQAYKHKDTGRERDKEYFGWLESLEWTDFQQSWWDMLQTQDYYEILWIVDYDGGIGKSTFCKRLHRIEDCAYFNNSGTGNIAYAYTGEEYVVFDFCRDNECMINYNAIEALKNGIIFSPKYMSDTKSHCPPKVGCFSNFYPKRDKLSKNRWNIIVYGDKPEHKFGDYSYSGY